MGSLTVWRQRTRPELWSPPWGRSPSEMWPDDLIRTSHVFRDFPYVTFGIVDGLEFVFLAPDKKLVNLVELSGVSFVPTC
ncbi:hypothetical protein V1289_002870 [Bradyrhizobium sp. AZCC 2289]